MNIRKLLNPLQEPLKRSRYGSDQDDVDSVSFNPKSWLPVEIIGYIMLFADRLFLRELRLVSRAWYTAYMRYHRCSFLMYGRNTKSTKFTLKGAINALCNNGQFLRNLLVTTTFFKELLVVESNLGDLIPNVVWLGVTLAGDLPISQWLSQVVSKMDKLQLFGLKELTTGMADEDFLEELDKALAGKKGLYELTFQDVHVTNMDSFPGPNLREIAHQLQTFGAPLSTVPVSSLSSKFALFCNVWDLGLADISSMEVLLAVANLLCESKNMPLLRELTVIAEFDITRTAPIQDPETGRKIRAYTLIDRICGIRRQKYTMRINIGFTVGACSSGNPELVEIERQFLIDLGKKHAEVLQKLHITHFLPTSNYDPLSTLFYESASRFPVLTFLNLYLPPTAKNKQRLINAMNNPFLLPLLNTVEWTVGEDADKEFVSGFDPLDPSCGIFFHVMEMKLFDQQQHAVEMGENIPSIFEPEDAEQ
ncbi:hypothetical protein GQ42DRAFT_158608 [Ramicandelaber brevisporus]|nr:hypothetical protein GQ42DRAFT_158608 [Ramicandelaber brevisporus]